MEVLTECLKSERKSQAKCQPTHIGILHFVVRTARSEGLSVTKISENKLRVTQKVMEQGVLSNTREKMSDPYGFDGKR